MAEPPHRGQAGQPKRGKPPQPAAAAAKAADRAVVVPHAMLRATAMPVPDLVVRPAVELLLRRAAHVADREPDPQVIGLAFGKRPRSRRGR